jgi:hypothetical protein
VSAYFLVALLVAGIVVVAVRYDDINATPDANSAAQMASNPITVFALVWRSTSGHSPQRNAHDGCVTERRYSIRCHPGIP